MCDLTHEEALVSLIAALDTPIMRRKLDPDVNECVRVVKAELVRSGAWERSIPKEDELQWMK